MGRWQANDTRMWVGDGVGVTLAKKLMETLCI